MSASLETRLVMRFLNLANKLNEVGEDKIAQTIRNIIKEEVSN